MSEEQCEKVGGVDAIITEPGAVATGATTINYAKSDLVPSLPVAIAPGSVIDAIERLN